MSGGLEATAELRVLLVEDNPDDALLIEELLAGENVAVALAHVETLAAGLAHLESAALDLVLLDLSLPDSYGLGSLDTIRGHAPDVPVVIMTGLAEEAQGYEAVRRGAQDYLVKGQLTGPLVLRTCRYALERHRTQKEILQREAHLRLLTEQLPAVLWTTDAQLRFTSSLGAGLLGLDLRPNEIVGRSLAEDDSSEGEWIFPAGAHRRALEGESVSFDAQWRDRVYHAHIEPLRIGGGHIVGAIGLAMDITEHRRREQDFQVARQIQQALLPAEAPRIAGFDIAGESHPADATGGDFFDYIPLREGALGIVIGDVSGHGFGPAILTAATHSYLRALARTQADVDVMLAITNSLLVRETVEEQFVTVTLARLDPKTRTLTYSSAGHPAAVILDPAGEARTRLEPTGPPLGWFSDSTFRLAPAVQLAPGELVLFLSDGIIEALSPERVLFGYDRALAIVQQHANRPAREIVERLCRAVRDFSGGRPQRDDFTAVVLKVEPHS